MASSGPRRVGLRAVLLAAALFVLAGSTPAQILPWEVNVAEIEAGRLRNLAQRLSKQNLLYQLHLGGMRKSDLVDTAGQIDHVLQKLERGSPSDSIPTPWTPAIREQVELVDAHWGPLRQIAVASPYEQIRVSREFLPAESRRGDPLLILYFDNLTLDFVEQSEKLLAIYHEECLKTGLEVCATARTSGYGAMLIERATKEAVYLVAGIDMDQHRAELKSTIEAYHELRRANNASPFFAAALDPARGPNAAAAGLLLASLREDWDAMQIEVQILTAGDEKNFDLRRLLEIQTRLVEKVERLTAALIRYASLAYGT